MSLLVNAMPFGMGILLFIIVIVWPRDVGNGR